MTASKFEIFHEPLSVNLIPILWCLKLKILSYSPLFVRSFSFVFSPNAGFWDVSALVCSLSWSSSFSAGETWCAFIQFKFTCRLKGHLKLIERQYFLISVHGMAWFSDMSGMGINRTVKHWLQGHWILTGCTCWCCRDLLPWNWKEKSGSRIAVMRNSSLHGQALWFFVPPYFFKRIKDNY